MSLIVLKQWKHTEQHTQRKPSTAQFHEHIYIFEKKDEPVKILKYIIYLHKGACNGSAPELVQQSFTHSYIRNTGHSICYYNDA